MRYYRNFSTALALSVSTFVCLVIVTMIWLVVELSLATDVFDVHSIRTIETKSEAAGKYFKYGSLDWFVIEFFPKLRIIPAIAALVSLMFIRMPNFVFIFGGIVFAISAALESARLIYIGLKYGDCKNTWYCHSLSTLDGLDPVPSFEFLLIFYSSVANFVIVFFQLLIVVYGVSAASEKSAEIEEREYYGDRMMESYLDDSVQNTSKSKKPLILNIGNRKSLHSD